MRYKLKTWMVILRDMNLDGYFMKYFYILRNMNDAFRPKSDRKGGNSGSTGNKHILKKNQCCLFIYLFFNQKYNTQNYDFLLFIEAYDSYTTKKT